MLLMPLSVTAPTKSNVEMSWAGLKGDFWWQRHEQKLYETYIVDRVRSREGYTPIFETLQGHLDSATTAVVEGENAVRAAVPGSEDEVQLLENLAEASQELAQAAQDVADTERDAATALPADTLPDSKLAQTAKAVAAEKAAAARAAEAKAVATAATAAKAKRRRL